MTPETPIQLQCPKHGAAPYVFVTFKGTVQNLCAVCAAEVLTRLGVHGMFPVGIKQDAEFEAVEWPESMEIE